MKSFEYKNLEVYKNGNIKILKIKKTIKIKIDKTKTKKKLEKILPIINIIYIIHFSKLDFYTKNININVKKC